MENTKQIKDLTLQTGVDGNEDILIQNNGVTKRIKSGEFLTEHQDISHLATKTSVSNLESEVSDLKKSALTEHQDISHLATKTSVSSLESEVSDLKKSALTEHQDISHLATKTSVSSLETEVSNLKKSALTEHQDISHLATKTSVSSLESEVSDLKKSALTEHQDISHLALKTEIPSLDGYATETFVTNKISEAELGGGSGNIDLSGYVTEDELNTKGYLTQHQSLDHLALKGHKHEEYLTEHQDISHLALKTEIPSLDGYVTEDELNTKGYLTQHQSLDHLALKGHKHEEYLTEHQSLGHLALKEHEHEEYLTEHQDISHLATKTSVSNLESEVSDLKQSVSDGKELIASAITDKGVNTSKTDSFQTMAENISKISGDNDDVLLAYSFENDVRGNAHGTILLNTQNEDTLGEYSIHWGDDNGVLSEYEEISLLTTTASSKLKTYEFIPLNAIPDNATRIIALHNGVISADFKIPDNKRLNINDKLFSYGALSDIHIDGDGADDTFSESDFTKEISYFETNGAVAICNSGDITWDGRECDVAAILNFINSTNLPIYTARGNHDNANDCSGLDNELYLSIEPNGNLFLKEINGEIFIFCGIISSSAGESSIFDDAQITQLSAWLKTYKDRRVFLHEHVFLGETGNIYNLYKGSGMSNSGNAGEFKKLMSKYRNVILCTGHSHLDFTLQRLGDHANINQRTNTLCHRVHIPSATKPRYNDIDTPDIKDNTYTYNLGAQGYLIDVYRNFIILKGMDFTKGKNLPYATYILDTTPIPISIENLTIPVNFGENTFTKHDLTITFDNNLIIYNGTVASTPNLLEKCTCVHVSGDFKTNVTYCLQLFHEGGSVDTTNRPEILDVSITIDNGATYIIQKDEKTLDDIYERIEFNVTKDCNSLLILLRPKGNMIFNNYTLSAIISEAIIGFSTIFVNFGENTSSTSGLTITFDNTIITYNGSRSTTPNFLDPCTYVDVSGDFKANVKYYIQLIHEGGSVDTTNRPEILDVSISDDNGSSYIVNTDERTLDDIYKRIEFNVTKDCSSLRLQLRPKGNMIFNNYAISVVIDEA